MLLPRSTRVRVCLTRHRCRGMATTACEARLRSPQTQNSIKTLTFTTTHNTGVHRPENCRSRRNKWKAEVSIYSRLGRLPVLEFSPNPGLRSRWVYSGRQRRESRGGVVVLLGESARQGKAEDRERDLPRVAEHELRPSTGFFKWSLCFSGGYFLGSDKPPYVSPLLAFASASGKVGTIFSHPDLSTRHNHVGRSLRCP